MNRTTPYRIINLPRSEKELNNSSRNRKGYYTYVSRFFSDFEILSKEEQEAVLVDNGIWDDDDEATVDSVMTPRTAKSYEVLRAASICWLEFPLNIQCAWKERAAALNLLPVKGKLKRIPGALKLPSLNLNVIDSLTHDWSYIVALFRSAIVRKSRSGESERRYQFGDEEVVLGNQIYRSFHLNYLVRLSLFGDDFAGLKDWEIIKKTRRVTVVHIASFTRVCKIFEIAGLSAVLFPKGSILYSCAGKVSLVSKGSNLAMVGYIIRETKVTFTVRCGYAKDIIMRKPRFENGRYVYDACSDFSNELSITQYWTIRFKISISGATSSTVNRLVLNDELKVVNTNH